MKYLIIGNGWIGNKLKSLPDSFLYPHHITTPIGAVHVIATYMPEFVINAAGKTGSPNIDWCEDNKEETFTSNTLLPLMLWYACQHLGVKLVQLGTGCIYEGKIFNEEIPANYLNSWYSKTKYIAEQSLPDDVLQLRIRMPIDSEPSPRNLITKLLAYDEIISVENSVTFICDLIKAVKYLTEKKASGIYNVVSGYALTHERILAAYNRHSKNKKEYKLITTSQLMDKVKAGRSNCTLSSSKLRINFKDTEEMLDETMKEYCKRESIKEEK